MEPRTPQNRMVIGACLCMVLPFSCGWLAIYQMDVRERIRHACLSQYEIITDSLTHSETAIVWRGPPEGEYPSRSPRHNGNTPIGDAHIGRDWTSARTAGLGPWFANAHRDAVT